MKRYRVVATPGAQRQIALISEWWWKNRPAARRLFDEDIVAAGEILASAPFSGTQFPSGTVPGVRRFLLARTHYRLYYTVDDEAGIVLVRALWHASRGARPRLR